MFDEEQRPTLDYLYVQSLQSICFADEMLPENKLSFKEVPLNSSNNLSLKDLNVASGQLCRLVNYTITDGAGNMKFLSASIYNDLLIEIDDKKIKRACIVPMAIVLVSEMAMFKVHAQILNLVYSRAILPKLKALIDETNNVLKGNAIVNSMDVSRPLISTEFLISILFHHLKIDGSNLNFSLVDDLENGHNAPTSLIHLENNLAKKCFKLENFDF